MLTSASSRQLRALLPHADKQASSLLFNTSRAVPCCNIKYAARAAAISTSSGIIDSELKTPTGFSAVLHPVLKPPPLQVVAAKGNRVRFSNGQEIEDTTSGAAVACIGYDSERVKNAMIRQIDKFSYSNSMFYGHPIGEELATELVTSTKGEMSTAYIMCSGKLFMESVISSNSL